MTDVLMPRIWGRPLAGLTRLLHERTGAAIGLVAIVTFAAISIAPEAVYLSDVPQSAQDAGGTVGRGNKTGSRGTSASPEWAFGGYGGIAHTHPSVVTIKDSNNTDLTVKDFGWIGRPFKAPIYYGLRAQRWLGSSPFGTMVDFTHAKAIAKINDVASFSGTLNGKPMKPKARIGDVFRHLEFSHGHNILTYNGLLRLAPAWARFRPYMGAGAGLSLPHTEVGLHSVGKRTYEYQFAGLAAQALAGVEIRIGRTSVFFEYKFTYAPYDVPLSHEPYGWLFVTDVWRQFSSWWKGTKPPGGRLRTTLITHHGVAGILVKNRSLAAVQ